jgi:hypothetical protein
MLAAVGCVEAVVAVPHGHGPWHPGVTLHAGLTCEFVTARACLGGTLFLNQHRATSMNARHRRARPAGALFKGRPRKANMAPARQARRWPEELRRGAVWLPNAAPAASPLAATAGVRGSGVFGGPGFCYKTTRCPPKTPDPWAFKGFD